MTTKTKIAIGAGVALLLYLATRAKAQPAPAASVYGGGVQDYDRAGVQPGQGVDEQGDCSCPGEEPGTSYRCRCDEAGAGPRAEDTGGSTIDSLGTWFYDKVSGIMPSRSEVN